MLDKLAGVFQELVMLRREQLLKDDVVEKILYVLREETVVFLEVHRLAQEAETLLSHLVCIVFGVRLQQQASDCLREFRHLGAHLVLLALEHLDHAH